MTDIADLIIDDHARIQRLFAALDSVSRYRETTADVGKHTPGRCMLNETWTRLDRSLQFHTEAEEEIWYPTACPAGERTTLAACCDDHRDIREALAEARLHEAGSRPWWRAVAAVRAGCDHHFPAEEERLLVPFSQRTPPESGRRLARHWRAFVLARQRDFYGAPAWTAATGYAARVLLPAPATSPRLSR